MIRVKICGITNIEDALCAYHCGADALGFVFYNKSPRYLTAEKAKLIIQQLPPFIQTVGLFVNHTKDEIDSILNQVPVNLLQFHGDESDYFAQLFKRPFIKAVRVKDASDIENASTNYPNAQGILVDHYKKDNFGGTGESFDWSLIPAHRIKPIILAGGLNCQNINKAITAVSPDSVDVSSGVEKEKGIKDHNLIKKFISCAKLSII